MAKFKTLAPLRKKSGWTGGAASETNSASDTNGYLTTGIHKKKPKISGFHGVDAEQVTAAQARESSDAFEDSLQLTGKKRLDKVDRRGKTGEDKYKYSRDSEAQSALKYMVVASVIGLAFPLAHVLFLPAAFYGVKAMSHAIQKKDAKEKFQKKVSSIEASFKARRDVTEADLLTALEGHAENSQFGLESSLQAKKQAVREIAKYLAQDSKGVTVDQIDLIADNVSNNPDVSANPEVVATLIKAHLNEANKKESIALRNQDSKSVKSRLDKMKNTLIDGNEISYFDQIKGIGAKIEQQVFKHEYTAESRNDDLSTSRGGDINERDTGSSGRGNHGSESLSEGEVNSKNPFDDLLDNEGINAAVEVLKANNKDANNQTSVQFRFNPPQTCQER